MPIYEYQCQKCGNEFEEWQRFSDPPVDKCRECGGKASRLISQSSFILKGSGWYVTDYGRKDSGANKKPSKNTVTCSENKTTDSSSSSSSSSSGSSSDT